MIDTSSVLSPWANFYVMTGSAAAALTGLMFVVITLVSGPERRQTADAGISTFSTPTVVHFGAALFMAAVLGAPWPSLYGPASVLAAAGLTGVIYIMRVWKRTKAFTSYNPDAEDWAWYTVLPLVAYTAILVGALMLPSGPVNAMFILAGGSSLLIFIGIRNAWDIVTYIVIGAPPDPPESS